MKNHFGTKNLKFKQGPKNGHFLKGLVQGFCPKMLISVMAVFHGNYVRKNRFLIFWIENNDYKTKKFKF